MKIGIIGAEKQEIALLQGILEGKEQHIATVDFYEGRIGNVEVVLVLAGIGKVNATIATQILITKFGVDYVINTGIAGALDPTLNIFDLVCSVDAVEHDFDATYFGYQRGQVPQSASPFYTADQRLGEIALKTFRMLKEDATVQGRFSPEDAHLIKHIKIVMGRVVSGDIFVTNKSMKDRLYRDFGAACVEMEGAAIAHVCDANKVPFIILRCISDIADKENLGMLSYDEFAKKAAFLSSRFVLKMLSFLA